MHFRIGKMFMEWHRKWDVVSSGLVLEIFIHWEVSNGTSHGCLSFYSSKWWYTEAQWLVEERFAFTFYALNWIQTYVFNSTICTCDVQVMRKSINITSFLKFQLVDIYFLWKMKIPSPKNHAYLITSKYELKSIL